MKQRFCLILLFFSFNLVATELTIVTEDLPPLQYNNHNKPASGAMVEVVNLMINEAKLSATIKFYPWARSYKMAQMQKNTLIFSMFRDPSREQYFQWIGQIYTMTSLLVALKSRPEIKVTELNDAKKYLVGSIRDDLAENYLSTHGFTEKKNLYLNSGYPALWKMLFNGRTDLVLTNNMTWRAEIVQSDLDSDKIRFVYWIPDISSDLYIAASLTTDKSIITKLQNALAQIKNDGRYQKILAKWQL
jgi:polar amino acid transport system substrate-binding protein